MSSGAHQPYPQGQAGGEHIWNKNINQRLRKKLDDAEDECARLRAALHAVRDVQDLGDAALQIIEIALSNPDPIATNDHSMDNL